MTLPPGTALGSYRIVELLGAGGMGEVYRARDRKLGREVAIKVLPESVSADPHELAVFEREARAVAAISHPNIRAIHELGRQGELVYAVMELLEGESLYNRIADGKLDPKIAADYAIGIARGLAAAHDKGIVHRDIKPDNVFITRDGFVKILDFGLAKRIGPAPPGDGSVSSLRPATETAPGTVVGTIDYMSPEQVRALPLDHRTDIFSFGVVVYEMLTGLRAFGRPNTMDTMAAIARDEPSVAAVPPAFRHIVGRCLKKDPAERFQTAREIENELAVAVAAPSVPVDQTSTGALEKWVLVVAAAALVAIVGVIVVISRNRAASPPAASLSPASTSPASPPVASASGHGKALPSEGGAAANAEASDAFRKGEDESQSLSRLEPRALALAIPHYEKAVALDPTFALAWAQLGQARSLAYDLGVPDPALATSAQSAARRAIELAPERPYGYRALGIYFLRVAGDARPARDTVEKAVQIAPSDAPALAARATARMSLGDWQRAIDDFNGAIRSDPRAPSALAGLGLAHLFLRRSADARDALERGRALAPANLTILEELAMSHVSQGDLEAARATVRQALKDGDPRELVAFFATYWDLGWVLERDQRDLLLRLPASVFADAGRWALCLGVEHRLRGEEALAREMGGRAVEELGKQSAAAPLDARRHLFLGVAHALAGKKDEAIREALQGVELAPPSRDACSAAYAQHLLARVYALVGENGKALDTLEALLKMPYFVTPAWLKVDPSFERLRATERFAKLVG